MAENKRRSILDSEGPLTRTFVWMSSITCSVSPFVDPLFFYIPVIDYHNKCLDFDYTVTIVACVLRSILDFLYFPSIILRSIRLVKRLMTQNFMQGKVSAACVVFTVILVDLFSILPILQWHFLGVSPSDDTPITVILVALYQRVYRVGRWLGKDVNFGSTLLYADWWPTAANSIYYCMLASHVVGSCWYLLSINSEINCWRQELKIHPRYFNMSAVACGILNQTETFRLNNSCSFVDPIETSNYGIFIGALTSHVVKSSKSFLTKLFYCFWWGLRNLSSFGQNLDTSTDPGEVAFATLICICSLLFVTLLLRNIQNIDRFDRKNWEEKRIKEERTEAWMSRQNIPKSTRKRIRQHENYKWENNWLVDEQTLISNLPRDIRRVVKRHLCSTLLIKVPQFETIDSYLLDALCGKLKHVLFIEKTCILLEGEAIEDMTFIKRGNLQIMAKDGPSQPNLKGGDFCGEELVTWALDPNSSSDSLPISTRTVQTISDVEAYTLMADDLKFIAPQLRASLDHKNSRTLAAHRIQKAWFRYKKEKLEHSLSAAEASSQSAPVMAAGTPSPAGSTMHASRFATIELASVWEKGESSNSSAT